MTDDNFILQKNKSDLGSASNFKMSVVLFPNTWWLMPGLYGVVGFIILTQLVWSFYNKHWSFTAMLGTLFLVVSLLFIVSLAMAGQPTNTCSPNAYFIASLGVSASIVGETFELSTSIFANF